MILSHYKSNYRESQQKYISDNLKDRMLYSYFIGDTSIEKYYKEIDNNIVLVKCPDNYESLSMKTYLAIKYIYENKIGEISSIFKTDDDIELDLDKIMNCVEENKNHKYFGLVSISNPNGSNYHVGKCESNELNRIVMRTPSCKYCAGGGYYLDKSILKNIIVSEFIFKNFIFEDVCVGSAMNRYSIFPHHVDMKSNGCSWVDPEYKEVKSPILQNPPKMTDVCFCGYPKNKRMSNFCIKCNRLY